MSETSVQSETSELDPEESSNDVPAFEKADSPEARAAARAAAKAARAAEAAARAAAKAEFAAQAEIRRTAESRPGKAATKWARMVARTIDAVLLGGPLAALTWMVMHLLQHSALSTRISAMSLVALGDAMCVVGYEAILVGATGATLGKRMFRLRVVDAETGARLGVPRGLIRVAALLTTVILFPRALVRAVHRGGGRPWHDESADSIVVRESGALDLADPTRTSRPLVRSSLVALVVTTIGLVGTGAIAAGYLHERRTVERTVSDAERSQVMKIATQYAVDLGTIDYSNLNAYLAKNKAHLTPSFYSEFEQFAGSLGSKIAQVKATVTGTVSAVGIQSLSRTRAVVLVFLVQTFKVSGSATTNVDRNPAVFDLVLTDGKWQIATFKFP